MDKQVAILRIPVDEEDIIALLLLLLLLLIVCEMTELLGDGLSLLLDGPISREEELVFILCGGGGAFHLLFRCKFLVRGAVVGCIADFFCIVVVVVCVVDGTIKDVRGWNDMAFSIDNNKRRRTKIAARMPPTLLDRTWHFMSAETQRGQSL